MSFWPLTSFSRFAIITQNTVAIIMDWRERRKYSALAGNTVEHLMFVKSEKI